MPDGGFSDIFAHNRWSPELLKRQMTMIAPTRKELESRSKFSAHLAMQWFMLILAVSAGANALPAPSMPHKSVTQPQRCECSLLVPPAPRDTRGNAQNPIAVTVTNPLHFPEPDRSGWVVAAMTGALAVVTGTLAFFTFGLWRSTSNLVREGHQTAHRELRAYVFPFRIEHVIPPVNRAAFASREVSILFHNFGKTPAYKFRVAAKAEIAMSMEHLELVTDSGPVLGHLAPNATHATTVPVVVAVPSGGDRPEVDTAKSTLYVHGRITYIDAFGVERYTTFRQRNERDAKFISCGVGNETDDNERLRSAPQRATTLQRIRNFIKSGLTSPMKG
jgi:hypothetical protein